MLSRGPRGGRQLGNRQLEGKKAQVRGSETCQSIHKTPSMHWPHWGTGQPWIQPRKGVMAAASQPGQLCNLGPLLKFLYLMTEK